MLISIGSGTEKVVTSAIHYISMPIQLYTDLCGYVDHYDTEVSGCGMVERIEHRTKAEDKDDPDTVEIEFRISEVYLPSKQDNSMGTTDIEDDTIADLMSTLLKQGKNTEHLRLHWHSHANMDTFHSGTDEDNYATLSNGDFLVSLVINKAHKFLGRVDYFKPVRVTISGVAVYMKVDSKCEISKNAEESIKKLDAYEKSKPQQVSWTDSTIAQYQREQELGYVQQEMDYNCADLTIDEMETAKRLDINMSDAKRYKGCRTYHCESCPDCTECNEFLYHTDNFGY